MGKEGKAAYSMGEYFHHKARGVTDFFQDIALARRQKTQDKREKESPLNTVVYEHANLLFDRYPELVVKNEDSSYEALAFRHQSNASDLPIVIERSLLDANGGWLRIIVPESNQEYPDPSGKYAFTEYEYKKGNFSVTPFTFSSDEVSPDMQRWIDKFTTTYPDSEFDYEFYCTEADKEKFSYLRDDKLAEMHEMLLRAKPVELKPVSLAPHFGDGNVAIYPRVSIPKFPYLNRF